MATGDRVAAGGDPMAGIASILQTLGGTETTVSPGTTAPLYKTLNQLRGQDFNALLQSIFQQAGGQIPGLQAAYANAIGARSGDNSVVQAALNELLKQTTLAGQQQIAGQQAQNLQTQTQAGGAIAQATKGTKQQSGTNLGQAAQMMAALQLISKLAGTGKEPGLVSQVGKSLEGLFTPAETTTAGAPAATYTPMLGAPEPSFMTSNPLGFTDAVVSPSFELQQGFGEAPVFGDQPIDYSGMFAPVETDYGLGNYSFDNQDFTDLDLTQPGGGLY